MTVAGGATNASRRNDCGKSRTMPPGGSAVSAAAESETRHAGNNVMASIWQGRPNSSEFQKMAQNTAIERLGIEFEDVGDDWLRARMPVDQRTHQPYGLLHGGASVLLAETLGSAAAMACVDPSAFFVVGIEINANHVRGVREGWVHGTARPVHLGRTTQVWEVRIVDDADRLVCLSRLTIGVVPKPSGR
jgi:1,4-dihydroxy-2-naphthoyl-CoA hydrolase